MVSDKKLAHLKSSKFLALVFEFKLNGFNHSEKNFELWLEYQLGLGRFCDWVADNS